MRFMLCFCTFFVVQVFSCKIEDVNCKKKQLLVVLELFKQYRELKAYHHILAKASKSDSRTSDDGNSSSGNVEQTTAASIPDVQPPNTTDSGNVMDMISHRLINPNQKIETTTSSKIVTSYGAKTVEELDGIIQQLRNLLLLIILVPDNLGKQDIDLVYKALVIPGNHPGSAGHNEKDKPVTTAHAILTTQTTTQPSTIPTTTPSYSNMHSILFSTTPEIPFSTTPDIPFSTTEYIPFPLLGSIKSSMFTTLTAAAPTNIPAQTKTTKQPAKLTKHQIRKKRIKTARARDAIKDYKDSVAELNEKMVEYRMMQKLLFGFGRK